MDNSTEAGTGVGPDDRAHGTDLHFCIGIDPKDLIAHFLSPVPADGMGDDDIAADRIIMRAFIALKQIFDRARHPSLL